MLQQMSELIYDMLRRASIGLADQVSIRFQNLVILEGEIIFTAHDGIHSHRRTHSRRRDWEFGDYEVLRPRVLWIKAHHSAVFVTDSLEDTLASFSCEDELAI